MKIIVNALNSEVVLLFYRNGYHFMIGQRARSPESKSDSPLFRKPISKPDEDLKAILGQPESLGESNADLHP